MTDENLNEEKINCDEKECCGKCKSDELSAKADEYLNNWKRERADFINYKKDELERTLSLVKHSAEKFVLNLLPILDNIYLAEKHLPENDEFKNGFSQIKKQLEEFLKKEGIEEIETLDKPFDPNFMEAIEGEGENIAEEVQKGYIMNGRVLRPAKVKITK